MPSGRVPFSTVRRKDDPEYAIWQSMKSRCHNPKHERYADYGGRGIIVCERWRNSFEAFIEDMGRRPSQVLTLDRKNTNGPYCKDNCRWVTQTVQQRNRRSKRMITVNGVARHIHEVAAELGVDPESLWARKLRGWPEEMISLPFPSYYRPNKTTAAT